MTVSALSNTDSTLPYDDAMRSLSPIPYSERGLRTATAQPCLKVLDEPLALEGSVCDIQDTPLLRNIYGGRVQRLSPHDDLKTLYTDSTERPSGIAIHRDACIFLAGAGDFEAGAIIAVDAQGKYPEMVINQDPGYVHDDLVFDEHGGFYLIDHTVMPATPGRKQIVLVSRDDSDGGAMFFCAHALTPGTRLFSHS